MLTQSQREHLQRKKRVAWVQGVQLPSHAPDELCGGRRLTGEEFAKRAAELLARDAAERERAKREAW